MDDADARRKRHWHPAPRELSQGCERAIDDSELRWVRPVQKLDGVSPSAEPSFVRDHACPDRAPSPAKDSRNSVNSSQRQTPPFEGIG